MKNVYIHLLMLLTAFSLMMNPIQSKADFGDFSGDTDYGDSWSDSSWDSGDDYSSWSDDDDYYYDDDDGGGGQDIPFEEMGWFDKILYVIETIIGVVGMIVFAGFMVIAFWPSKSGKSKNKPKGAERATNLRPLSEFKELDPDFDEPAFREHLSNLYMKMQEEWHNKDIESLKPYFTDAFYNQSEKQLDQKRRDHQTPCTERVAVLGVDVRGFYQSGGMDHMVVSMRTRIIAYVLDDNTGKVISGSKTTEKFMEYEWDLCRKSGVTTQKSGKMRSVSCPHCGAPLDINQTAKCPYCDSIVTVVNEDWALNNIKGISQRSA